MKLYFIIPFLFSLSAWAKPCGLQGNIEERIKDCAQIKGTFALVAVSEKGMEIYKDVKSGLIWGGRIISDFNHYGSQKACADEVSGYQMSSLKWRLPTIKELEDAYMHGMKAAIPNTQYSFWSSTPVQTKKNRRRRRNAQPSQVYLWDGFEERADVGDLKDAASVRCVAKE
ncbi:MAG: DUF1566 domain-containing protein [Bdellovibrionales bacterium]|nr:DUF1566 domain-containing protein [Bdellovibrionales bacterium]